MGELLEEPKHTGEAEETASEKVRSSLLEATNTIEKPDGVKLGDTVTIQFSGEADTETIRIVEKRSTATEISLSSPLGTRIVGAKIGDTITYTASGNQTERITVLAINPAPKVEPSETQDS